MWLGSASTDCTRCRSCTALRVARGERLGQEIRLLLVVAFEADAVARLDRRFEQRHGVGAATRLPSMRASRARPADAAPRRCDHARSSRTRDALADRVFISCALVDVVRQPQRDVGEEAQEHDAEHHDGR